MGVDPIPVVTKLDRSAEISAISLAPELEAWLSELEAWLSQRRYAGPEDLLLQPVPVCDDATTHTAPECAAAA